MGKLTQGRIENTRPLSPRCPAPKRCGGSDGTSSVIGSKAAKNGHAQASAQAKSKRAKTPVRDTGGGVTMARRFTQPGTNPLDTGAPGEHGEPLVYERRSSIITNPDG